MTVLLATFTFAGILVDHKKWIYSTVSVEIADAFAFSLVEKVVWWASECARLIDCSFILTRCCFMNKELIGRFKNFEYFHLKSLEQRPK
jgi:hypothetical protein